MADAATVVAGLRSDFNTRFAAAEPNVQILHDNEQRLGVKAGTTKPSSRAGDEWVRVSIATGAASMPEVGSTLSDQTGRFEVSIFVPLGVGDARVWALYDTIKSLYQGTKVAGARLRQAEPILLGASPDNVWFGMTCSIRFWFENTT